jgi:hypothetical protein
VSSPRIEALQHLTCGKRVSALRSDPSRHTEIFGSEGFGWARAPSQTTFSAVRSAKLMVMRNYSGTEFENKATGFDSPAQPIETGVRMIVLRWIETRC